MIYLLLLAAAAEPGNPPVHPLLEIVRLPTAAENIYLRPGHANSDDRMFPDIAVKDMRIDGDTLYVLVKNQGGRSARGIQVTAQAEGNGAKSDAAPARLANLPAGKSKWVTIGKFKIVLADASLVSAAAKLPAATPAALDRSGGGCDGCSDLNETNNSLTEEASSIARGKPE